VDRIISGEGGDTAERIAIAVIDAIVAAGEKRESAAGR
jgi:hypothetical protein